jgi:Uncharacterized protein conserved in bacteria
MKCRVITASTAGVAVAWACTLISSANAETPAPSYVGMTEQDVGVMDRARPAYDAKGIPLGGFRLFPTLSSSASYDDNIFKTESAVSDWLFTISPDVRLKSEWGRHFFEIYSGLNYYNYADHPDENLVDWRGGADGRLDISRAANVKANAFFGQGHELWSAPNNVGFQQAPNRYFQTHADTAAVYQPNRLGFGLGGVFDRYNWTTTPKIGGGFLYNDDRDQNEYQAYAKVYYDFSPGYSGYLKASYDERDFDMYFDRSGLHRSSHGYRIDGGANIQISHLVSGEIYLGYLQQNFASAALHNVSGFDYGVQLDWYVSPVLTAHISANRSLDDVVLSGISVADNKNVAISADYEFRPNIILQGRFSYTNAKYVGSGRTDDYPSAGVGIKYLVNRYASLNFNYNYSERSTNSSGLDYTDNTLSFGLTLHI